MKEIFNFYKSITGSARMASITLILSATLWVLYDFDRMKYGWIIPLAFWSSISVIVVDSSIYFYRKAKNKNILNILCAVWGNDNDSRDVLTIVKNEIERKGSFTVSIDLFGDHIKEQPKRLRMTWMANGKIFTRDFKEDENINKEMLLEK